MSDNASLGKTKIVGPHQAIAAADDREHFALEMFDSLWDRYRTRVGYVADYERVVYNAGATFVNDHIALRSFASQRPLTGIASLSRIFEALGYVATSCYHFSDKHLNAIHLQHTNRDFPKVFVSELRTWELSPAAQQVISRIIADHRLPIDVETLASLSNLGHRPVENRSHLLETVIAQFHELPWNLPEKQDLLALNADSQYAAWVAVHGYNINHFTSLINSHGIESLGDIEQTVAALKTAGVPMKATIEGEPGSKLRQSATEAAVIDVHVTENGCETTMPWTYAYFELAERGNVTDPDTGQPVRFEGFLGPQATQLFEMTRLGNG